MSAAQARDPVFDGVKGVLVLLMVVYHALSIASTAGAEVFRVLRFVSGSFIFITGLLLAWSASRAPRLAAPPRPGRLVLRGLKVVFIFVALNLMIQASGFGNPDKIRLASELSGSRLVSLLWQPDGRIASFVILLPIGYLLMAAPALRFLTRIRCPMAVPSVLAGVLLAAALPAFTRLSPVIEFMLVGIVGVLVGTLAGRYGWRPRAPSNRLLASLGLLTALWLAMKLESTVAGYSIGIALLMAFLASLFASLPQAGGLAQDLARLGRYSLFCYIAQIVLIHALFRAASAHRWPPGAEVVGLCVAVGLMLWGACKGLDHLRERSSTADRSYRAVFS